MKPPCGGVIASIERNPSELLIRASFYQQMYASNAATNSSIVVESQSRAKNISFFSRPEEALACSVVWRAPLA